MPFDLSEWPAAAQSLDWELEARRIARAFGVRGECEFVPTHNPHYVLLESDESRKLNLEADSGWRLNLADNLNLIVTYHIRGRSFQVYRFVDKSKVPEDKFYPEFQTDFILDWNDSPRVLRHKNALATTSAMLRGLYHLDWLTPEVEAAFGITVSAHEKLEWALERDAENEPKPR